MLFEELLALNTDMRKFLELVTDAKRPLPARLAMLTQAVLTYHEDQESLISLMKPLLDHVAQNHEVVAAAQLKCKYDEALRELDLGPLRTATFVRLETSHFGSNQVRAHVVLSDGQRRPVTIADHIDRAQLQAGVTVWLDPKGAILLDISAAMPETGQVASFHRTLHDGTSVELHFREETLVLNASHELAEMAASGELVAGDQVTFCPQRQFAFAKLPARTDRKHRFVDTTKIAEVIASRDIGSPHWVLDHLLFRAHVMLHRPDLMERFRLRPRSSVLFVGPSGVGKTLTIQAFLFELNKMMRELTGRDDIGSRVIRVKSGTLLSEWFGVTDRRIDELFDDVIFLAGQKYELPDGRQIQLPVVLLLEEVEALGKRRGSEVGDVYDRVLGMLLQRLDDPTDSLSKLPIFIISSSNRPELIDSALVRRLGGMKANFPRLDRVSFAAVLGKKIWSGFPCASHNGTRPDKLRQRLIQHMTALLYGPNCDQGQVELTLRDNSKLLKYRRDFLTGAVVEQAVANAIDRLAYETASNGDTQHGLSVAELAQSFCQVVDSLVDNLTAFNAADYLDLPDQSSVAHIRRLPQTDSWLAHTLV